MSTDQPLPQPVDGPVDQPVDEPTAPAPGGPHVPSLVMGLAALLAAVLVGLAVLTDVRVDASAVTAVALVVLGALLVVGGLAAGARGR